MPEHTPQRIVSLQPSATVTLAHLGELGRLVACTRYCADVCPEVAERGVPLVADSWTAQTEEILAAQPDLVLASVPYQLEAVAAILKAGVRFLGLAPRTLNDIYTDIATIAGAVGAAERGMQVIAAMQEAITQARMRAAAGPRPLVFCEEWGKPIIASQPWVAELVEAAGGCFLGEPGRATEPGAVRAADPEIIIAAWCGAGDRVPLEKLIEQRGWQQVRAARAGRVYCVSDELLNTPGPTLLGGLQALEAALRGEDAAVRGLRRMAAPVI
jgi:iron complex transport system substrate-binding protein